MTSYRNSAEGGTLDAVVSGANSGGASGTPFTAGAVFAFKDDWGHGSLCMGVDNPGTGTPSLRWSDGAVNKTSRGRFYYGDTTEWPGDIQFVRVTNAADSTNLFQLVGKSTEKLRVLNFAGTQVWESTGTLPHDLSEVRIEWRDHNTGTTTTDGTLRVGYGLGSAALTEDSGLLTGNFGAGSTISMFRFGKLSATSYTGNIRVDDLAVDTGSDAVASTWIGPVSTNVAPTLSLGSSLSTIHPGQSSTITATASDSDGTISSLTWSTTAGTLSGSGTTRDLLAPPSLTDQTATVQVIATDNGGATDTKTLNVTLKASMSKVFNGSVWLPLVERLIA